MMRAMADAPRDRRILIGIEGEDRLYCGQWIAAEIAGRGGPFWCTDRVHAAGIKAERAARLKGWLPLPGDETADAIPSVPEEGAHYWIVDRTAPPAPMMAQRYLGQWWTTGWEIPLKDSDVTIVSPAIAIPAIAPTAGEGA